MTEVRPIDLIVLVPGKDERAALDGLLRNRYKSLGIRLVGYDFLVAAQRDPGCYRGAQALLATFRGRANHALVVFDHFGSGQEDHAPEAVELEVEQRLAKSGWGERAAAIVLRPELESWVWSRSAHVDDILGWRGRTPALREWLQGGEHWPDGRPKPSRPKRCMQAALREVRMPQSSKLFRMLAERVSLAGCGDEAFHKLRRVLRDWFPIDQG
jgi:hypothetical protein